MYDHKYVAATYDENRQIREDEFNNVYCDNSNNTGGDRSRSSRNSCDCNNRHNQFCNEASEKFFYSGRNFNDKVDIRTKYCSNYICDFNKGHDERDEYTKELRFEDFSISDDEYDGSDHEINITYDDDCNYDGRGIDNNSETNIAYSDYEDRYMNKIKLDISDCDDYGKKIFNSTDSLIKDDDYDWPVCVIKSAKPLSIRNRWFG